MENNNLPLEHLAAFAIVLAAGILSCAGFGRYVEKVKRDAIRDAKSATGN